MAMMYPNVELDEEEIKEMTYQILKLLRTKSRSL